MDAKVAALTEKTTYKKDLSDTICVTVFGGRDADWSSSRAEALAYLKANAAAWEAAG